MQEVKKKMMKVDDIGDIKKRLIECVESHLGNGTEAIDTHELGEVIDMIKDLAEAEEKCMKACYYETIVKAMHEESEEDERMGYNPNRYASGRYAPKGHGSRMGYDGEGRMGHHDAREMMGDMWGEPMMGYTGSSMGSRSDAQSGSTSRSGYGASYDRYQEARRHYTETKSPADKSEMDSYAGRHLGETIATMKEIWKDADPALRKQMKTDMTTLINEMN